MLKRLVASLVVLTATVAWPVSASTRSAAPDREASASARQTQPPPDKFVKMPDSELGKEQLPAAPLVFAAYAFVWVALVAYVFMLAQRLRRAERDLADVSSRVSADRR